MRISRTIALSLLLLFTSCLFGPNAGPRVLGYRQGRVYLTRDGSYQVGLLPDGWRRMRTGGKAITFHHAATGATIMTGALCGAAFEDQPLPRLLGQLFGGFPIQRTIRTERLVLDGREALRELSLRTLDGVPIQFDAVVLKKHGCSFDLICMAPPERYAEVAPAFDAFFRVFAFE
ncbi:MAG: hypothetical protein HYV03_02955 [Deltaproteobacteria bacterium]|nr:hypothetical protein [Deltaproteobacteria bacterium]